MTTYAGVEKVGVYCKALNAIDSEAPLCVHLQLFPRVSFNYKLNTNIPVNSNGYLSEVLNVDWAFRWCTSRHSDESSHTDMWMH